MSNTPKKLLSISNLKKYFPVAKTSIFQRDQYYVKANEEISLDIYEGETIGIVGESGCGKSTLGRVLLQLYDQTAGESMYYGRTVGDVAPKYVKNTLVHIHKEIDNYEKLKEKADSLSAQVDQIGEDNADFFLLQNKELAKANADTQLAHIVKIIGGFFAVPHRGEGVSHLLKIHNSNVKLSDLRAKLAKTKAKIEYLEGLDPKTKKDGTVIQPADTSAYRKAQAKSEDLCQKIKSEESFLKILQDEMDVIKSRYKDDPKFNEYEALLDDGIDLARLTYKEMRPLRQDLQIIFQDPYSSLNPRMTIGQIIEEGLVTHNFYRHGSKTMREYIMQVMKDCGLQEYMIHRFPHQFSGGQRQRICIARALAVKPKFVVCDECVSALDVSIQSQIINLLEDLKQKEGLTYLFISHDLSVVKYISDKIGVMYLGNIVEYCDSKTMFADPRHPYTIALLSSIPTTEADNDTKERILLEGNIPSPIKPPTGCKFHTRCYMATEKCKRVPPKFTEVEPGHFVACHFLEKKLDESGNFLFELSDSAKKSKRTE